MDARNRLRNTPGTLCIATRLSYEPQPCPSSTRSAAPWSRSARKAGRSSPSLCWSPSLPAGSGSLLLDRPHPRRLVRLFLPGSSPRHSGRAGLVVSPADGRIASVALGVPPRELGLGEGTRRRISVFMSVFDCHVNRVPMAGRVARIVYTPGKFLNAELDKASEHNERNAIVVDTPQVRSAWCRSPAWSPAASSAR